MTMISIIFKVSELDDALNAVTLKSGLMPDGIILGYNPIMLEKTDPAWNMVAVENCRRDSMNKSTNVS